MAERSGFEGLHLGPEVRKLKLGDSFTRNGHTAFHTFRYDFKPASMDTKKMSTVEVGPNNQTTVTVPNVDTSGMTHSAFKGSRKPYAKECVLIIDHATGEIVLEKLSSNVQLKKTRAEGSSKILQRPITPVEQPGSKKPSPPQRCSPNQRITSQSPLQRTPPNHTSPNHISPNNISHKSPANQRSPSMPSLVPPIHTKPSMPSSFTNKDTSMPLLTGNDFAMGEPATDAASEVGILSDSSNDSSSSGGTSSSSSDSSDSEGEDKDASKKNTGSVDHHPMSNSQYSSNSNSYHNMPHFSQLSQLSEDLHLSESESDSDG